MSNYIDQITLDGVTKQIRDTTIENKQPVSGGTDTSLVTTGDKYNWNNKVSDVQTNGTSVVTNGIANIPMVSSSQFGVVMIDTEAGCGLKTKGNNKLAVATATDEQIKTGLNNFQPITAINQHTSVFYALAKLAGADMSSSSNPVGTFTEEAKTGIRAMFGIDIGISLVEDIAGSTPTITGQPNTLYKCGEVSTISITPPASGSVDVIFTSGSTATLLTVPNTVKFPSWFDATALETNTIYEIIISNGVYGSVMTWAS